MKKIYFRFKSISALLGLSMTVFFAGAQDDRGGACYFGNYNANFSEVSYLNPNFLVAYPYQGYSGMTITHLCMTGNNTNSGVQLALYGDNNGAPGSLLGYTALHNVTQGPMILPISPVEITSSGQYWIAMIFENEGTHISMTTQVTNTVYYMSYTYGNGVPSTFNTTLSYTNEDYNLWAAAAYIVEEDVNSCGPYTLNGQTYSSNETVEVFTNNDGCYSFVTTNINVFPALDLTIVQDGNTLTVNQTGAAYQWVDCNMKGQPIDGATSQSFTPTASGIYAVQLTTVDCVEYSECISVSLGNVSIENNEQQLVNLYPNPANNVIHVELKDFAKIQILSVSGQVLMDLDAAQTYQVDLTSLSQGVYFVRVNNETLRFVKQ
jgi:hypothetical protein